MLDQGFSNRNALGLPKGCETVEITPSEFKVPSNNSILAERSDVILAIDDPKVVLLDNRDAREWYAESSSPYDADGKDFSPRLVEVQMQNGSNGTV